MHGMTLRHCKRLVARGLVYTLCLALILPLYVLPAAAQVSGSVDPDEVRAAAIDQGLASLTSVPLPAVDLSDYLNPGAEAQRLLVVMGKSLFWDMQVGSDGQACASCHFSGGADPRSKNQLNPNTKGGDTVFGNSTIPGVAGFTQFGPNYTLAETDFPTHQLLDPENPNYITRQAIKDTNDVVSSQGVFKATFGGVVPGALLDIGTPVPDEIFNVGGINVRRVEPRNTPTMINALFNFVNFWDGRAHNHFNGSSVIGPLDDQAGIYVQVKVGENKVLQKVAVSIPNSSLASQALGPPLSPDEMSFDGRTWPDIGRKLLGARPLQYQEVSRSDSILGADAKKGSGLTYPSYAVLVKNVFQPKYWNAGQKVQIGGTYSQMEANFSLFFGLAVQAYEFTLRSDQTRYDRFMDGDNTTLTQEELAGLLVFMNIGAPSQVAGGQFAGLFNGVGRGACIPCHFGGELTSSSVTVVAAGPVEIDFHPILVDGILQAPPNIFNPDFLFFQDEGIYDIGVRPSGEDLGRGGTVSGIPISYVGQAQAGLNLPFAQLIIDPEFGVAPTDNRISTAGKFKVPGLRNLVLSAPYFHNGGMTTLEEVVEFYDRHGDFADVNLLDVDGPLSEIELGEGDEELLIAFLLSLTDNRVVDEQAPFDHPQLFVADDGFTSFSVVNGEIVPLGEAIVVPAVGAAGRSAAGLPGILTFPAP